MVCVRVQGHRVKVLFWWFKVLGNLQGAHCEYQKALDGHNNDSYAHQAVDRPSRFMAGTDAVTFAPFVTDCLPHNIVILCIKSMLQGISSV